MDNERWSQGPWWVSQDGNYEIKDDYGNTVCKVIAHDLHGMCATDKRNADLIAKAPELVEVVKELMDFQLEHINTPDNPAFDKASRLLKQIRGNGYD